MHFLVHDLRSDRNEQRIRGARYRIRKKNVELYSAMREAASPEKDSDDNLAERRSEDVAERGGVGTTCDPNSTGVDEVAALLQAALLRWLDDGDRTALSAALGSVLERLK